MFFINTDIDLILNDLVRSHLLAIKSEFEAEGVRRNELSELALKCLMLRIPQAIKIGGCEARTDLYDAIAPHVDFIIAPMIETSYAAIKFCQLVKSCSKHIERVPSLLINIETHTALLNIDSILDVCLDYGIISGVVFGRVDFTSSLGLSREDLPSNQVSDACLEAATKTKSACLDFVVGGGISAESLGFLRSVREINLSRFETRKCIFSSLLLDDDTNFANTLGQAVAFELLWLKAKKLFYIQISQEDETRIEMLSRRHLFKLG